METEESQERPKIYGKGDHWSQRWMEERAVCAIQGLLV